MCQYMNWLGTMVAFIQNRLKYKIDRKHLFHQRNEARTNQVTRKVVKLLRFVVVDAIPTLMECGKVLKPALPKKWKPPTSFWQKNNSGKTKLLNAS